MPRRRVRRPVEPSRSRSGAVDGGVIATYKDGRTVTCREVYAIDFEGKETKAMRYYVGDLAFLD